MALSVDRHLVMSQTLLGHACDYCLDERMVEEESHNNSGCATSTTATAPGSITATARDSIVRVLWGFQPPPSLKYLV